MTRLAGQGLSCLRGPVRLFRDVSFEVAPGERDSLEEVVRREMGGAADLAVPLDVSVGTGRSWHDAAH